MRKVACPLFLLHRVAQFLVLATFLLLLAGGLVTSTDSGLAVPDWPLSYGSFFPPLVGGILYEHTHRLLGAFVGLLTLVLTIWIGKTESRASVRWLAIACLVAVVLQGILGGLTVLFLLPTPISVAHACLGPLFFCLVVSLATLTSPTSAFTALRNESSNGNSFQAARPFPFFSAGTTSFIFLQILLGAVVRHTGRGLWLHLSSALVLFLFVGLLVSHTLNYFSDVPQVLRPALFLGFLVTVEFFLGIGAFVFTRMADGPSGIGQAMFPTLHQTLASLMLATGVVLTLRSRGGVGVQSI